MEYDDVYETREISGPIDCARFGHVARDRIVGCDAHGLIMDTCCALCGEPCA